MKKVIIALTILLFSFPFSPLIRFVHAQEANPCKADPGQVKYEDAEQFGFEITKSQKTDPAFPIVFGQDLEEKTGIKITIEIQSTPGKISYETHDGYTDKCIGYPTRQDGLDLCYPYHKDGNHYYMTSVPICTPHENEEVYRNIRGESLQVWLAPSEDTLKWLGWNTTGLKGGQYPLRYVFPEKWSLGTWTPEGFTTVGSDLMYTEEQIDRFIAENPGFEFLKSDPREEDLPSYALLRTKDPMTEEGAPQRALALFGEFYSWYRMGKISSPGECLVNRLGTYGICGTSTNLSQSDPSEELFNADLTAKGITYLRLDMYNVPMDLPGQWYIGARVSVEPATYDNGRRTEVVPDPMKLSRYPTNGYELMTDEHTFLVYILISTPCNGAEMGGCDT